MLNQNNNKKAITKKSHIAEGKWTRAEHDRFLRGMELYGRNWSMVHKKVKTRTITQVRSHAQKVFQNMSKEDIDALIGCTKDEEGFQDAFSPLVEGDYISRKQTRRSRKNIELRSQEDSSPQLSSKQGLQTGENEDIFKSGNNLPPFDFQKLAQHQSSFMDIFRSQWGYFSNGGSFLGLTGLFNPKITFQTQNFNFTTEA